VQQAAEHGLALSSEDLQLLLQALLMLTQLQARMSDQDITLHKLRKLAGIVNASEKLKHIVPDGGQKQLPRQRATPKSSPPPRAEAVIHARCQHQLAGLEKGQRCPDCERGTLYKYAPAVVLRISGQAPLMRTQHCLERLRCNACGIYFTASLPQAVQQDGPLDQTYGYSARALMGIQKYFAGAPFYRQQTLGQLLGMEVECLDGV
jgi:hypothetical protein